MTIHHFAIESTASRTYHESIVHSKDDEQLRFRLYTYRTPTGDLVAGAATNVMFTINRPASQVWAVLKDFNRWQNEHKYFYSGVLGDLEGKSFSLSVGVNEPKPHYYEVVKAIPEYLLILNQPVLPEGESAGFPGRGGVSPGFHVFLLNEHDGRTTVTVYMEHSTKANETDENAALAPWRERAKTIWLGRWRDDFIRSLKAEIHKTDR